MTSRRTFLISATAAASLYLVGCKERVKVLKYPENAEEAADLFEFFTTKSFTFDQAVAGLPIIGNGSSYNTSNKRRHIWVPTQNELIDGITLETVGNELSAMDISYKTSVRISLGRLESMIGTSKDHSGPVVGQLERSTQAPVTAFTNVVSNGGRVDRNHGSYGFYPAKPLSAEHYKGTLKMSCKYSDDNLKEVTHLWYRRLLAGDE